MIKVLYPCDPSKNTACTKEACGDLCKLTSDPSCCKDGAKFKDLVISKPEDEPLTLIDKLILSNLEKEFKEEVTNDDNDD